MDCGGNSDIHMQFELSAADAARSYAVASGPDQLPSIVERHSVCGGLQLHAPASVPPGPIDVLITPADPVHDLKGVQAKINAPSIVFQGHVVRAVNSELLVSNGGMLVRVAGCQVDLKPDTPVRTEITWSRGAS